MWQMLVWCPCMERDPGFVCFSKYAFQANNIRYFIFVKVHFKFWCFNMENQFTKLDTCINYHFTFDIPLSLFALMKLYQLSLSICWCHLHNWRWDYFKKLFSETYISSEVWTQYIQRSSQINANRYWKWMMGSLTIWRRVQSKQSSGLTQSWRDFG